ncbi:MAG TPA: DUF5696 domain-containing protein [Candidatus Brocadiia bacterium]|nr:DUF5696 domain-containing protein [Candidatus Brocadiia bacterium]
MDLARLLAPAALVLAAGCAALSDAGAIALSEKGGLPERVEPGAGRWPLVDLGIYRVAYRYTDGRAGEMPPSWTGHFYDANGISFTPRGRQDGKGCLLIHCPWKNGTGTTTATYPLRLPDVKPIRLEFSIAMWKEIAVEGKSDGSDFRARVKRGDRTVELMNTYYSKGEWEDHSFDLSEYAGSDIELSLETGPGPNNNPGFDYSFFGDPTIVIGDASATHIAREWERPADLKSLQNRRGEGCRPSTAWESESSCSWNDEAGVAVFRHKGPDCEVVYCLKPGNVWIDRLTVFIIAPDGSIAGTYRACVGGGPTLFAGKGIARAGESEVESAVGAFELADDGSFNFVNTHEVNKKKVFIVTSAKLEGRSLRLSVSSKEPRITEFAFGTVLSPIRRRVEIPYLSYAPISWLADSGAYSSLILDWTKSNATSHSEDTAIYAPKTDGSLNPLDQCAYLTFSPQLAEVLPNIPFQKSPFIEDLAGRIMFDVWGGRYAEDADWFEELASYGVRDAAIIKHVWQRSGYDNALPNHVPADPNLGTEDDMRRFVSTTVGLGYRTSLHENYVDFYPNSDYWNEKDLALQPDGKWFAAWFNGAVQVQSYFMKTTECLKYAKLESPEVHRRYGTNASYLDVHPCVDPWFRVDADAAAPGAGMFITNLERYAELYEFERKTHDGPLFGEGHRHFFWAGLCDGVEAQILGGEAAPLLPDFDLLKIHPQMVNHGVGYLERWLNSGYSSGWHDRTPTPEQLDKYRATELAYGHAGFVANQFLKRAPYVIREYYLVTPIQKRCAAAQATSILYDVAGKLATADEALPAGQTDRVKIAYDSGMTVLVNRTEDEWSIEGETLPAFGWMAKGAGLDAATKYLPTADGSRVIGDYAEADGTIYADARTWIVNPFNHAVRIQPLPPEVRPAGPRRFEITYRWLPKSGMARNWCVYVHFTNDRSSGPEQIVFQNDHHPATPTLEWKPEVEVSDGPHVVELPKGTPDGRYDIKAGLHEPAIGRLRSEGVGEDADGRAMLGTIVVKDGKVSYEPPAPAENATESILAGYLKRMNVEREVADFGKVQTNGCVIIKRRSESGAKDGVGLIIIPAPREEEFIVRIDLPALTGESPAQVELTSLDRNGAVLGRQTLTLKNGWIEWKAGEKGVVSFQVRW